MLLKEWEINYREQGGVIQQLIVKKMSYLDAHKAACEMRPNAEIISIVEGDIVVDDSE